MGIIKSSMSIMSAYGNLSTVKVREQLRIWFTKKKEKGLISGISWDTIAVHSGHKSWGVESSNINVIPGDTALQYNWSAITPKKPIYVSKVSIQLSRISSLQRPRYQFNNAPNARTMCENPLWRSIRSTGSASLFTIITCNKKDNFQRNTVP